MGYIEIPAVPKGTPQEMFNGAAESYKKAEAVIRELYNEAKSDLPGFSFELEMSIFDCFLQSVMLMAAATDGYFHHLEKEFIQKITCYGDVLKSVVVPNFKIDVTWEMLEEKLQYCHDNEFWNLTGSLVQLMAQLTPNFVDPLARVDATKEKDCLEELLYHMRIILSYLAAVDGDEDLDNRRLVEISNSYVAIKQLISDRWIAIRDAK